MALHIINQVYLLTICRPLLQSQDALLLIEEATYCLANDHWHSPTTNLYGLQDDIARRGIMIATHLSINLINYQQWVILTMTHEKVHCWH